MRRALFIAVIGLHISISFARADGYDTARAALEAADYPLAIDALADLAEDGDTLAATMLANLLISRTSDGNVNALAAAAWLEEAAERGSIHAMLELGLLYQMRPWDMRFGGARATDGYPQAILWFERAAGAGSPVGEAFLGKLFRLGWSRRNDVITADQEEAGALLFLENAAEAGVAFAQSSLATVVLGDDRERMEVLMQSAAAAGDGVALGYFVRDVKQGGNLTGITDPIEGYAWALAAQVAIDYQGDAASGIMTMQNLDDLSEYAALLAEIGAPLTDAQRTEAQARAEEITADWMSFMPGGPRPGHNGGGASEGRNLLMRE